MVDLGVAGGVLVGAWLLLPADLSYAVTFSILLLIPVVVVRLQFAEDFRPMAEHVFDLLLLGAVLAAAALMAALTALGARWVNLASANTSASFSALVTAAMAVPAALWVRRSVLGRRYGTGLLSPADVAVITADLHTQTEPRDLLDKAARMVAAASASADARIILGDDALRFPSTGPSIRSTSAVTASESLRSKPETRRGLSRARRGSSHSCCHGRAGRTGGWARRRSGACPAGCGPRARR